jgi:hypothetical protein
MSSAASTALKAQDLASSQEARPSIVIRCPLDASTPKASSIWPKPDQPTGCSTQSSVLSRTIPRSALLSSRSGR